MPIDFNTYGKTRVRMMYMDRAREPHQVREITIAVLFEGQFDASYTIGDNSSVLPTDTMKNTVYVLARQLHWDSVESLALGIAKHFLDRLPHVNAVKINAEQTAWTPIGQHTSAFSQSAIERRTARLTVTRSDVEIHSGLTGLQILKTSNSGFAGFLKDEFTTLPETHDRLFGTVLEAEWKYLAGTESFNDRHHEIRTALLDRFATHRSLSVQHTLFAMAEAALEKAPAITEIRLVMPNKHCNLVDLARFGLDNPNQVFIPTDEPSGYIEARVTRG